MSKATAARLTRAEQNGHQHILDELAKRPGFLRWAIFAIDAEPDPARPGEWRSDTVELLASLPFPLRERAMELVDGGPGYVDVYPDPNHDDEPN